MAGAGDPLTQALRQLSGELSELARVADSFQDIVGILVRNAGPTVNSAAVEEAQRLDYIVQRLLALAAETDALAAGQTGEAAQLSQRWRADNAISGEIDLF